MEGYESLFFTKRGRVTGKNMNQTLEKIYEQLLAEMKEEEDVLGAWDFGSATHGLSDEYSDVDVIFLVKGNAFQRMNEKLPAYMKSVCDEVILCWPETFNNDAITNYGHLIKKGDEFLQFDVFLMNADQLDDFMCRLHYTDLKEENVLFDRTGDVRKLVQAAPKGTLWSSDLKALNETYWFHVNMTIKYLKRQDFFKLNHLMRILMDTHVSVILTGYDRIQWGGTANKLHFVPEEKRRHVMKYGCVEDFEVNRRNLLKEMSWFEEDYGDVCRIKGIPAQAEPAKTVKEIWNKQW